MINRNIAMLVAMMMASNEFENHDAHTKRSKPNKPREPNKPKEPVIPKGCRMFYFDKDGQEVPVKTEGIVFDCVALNSKSAAIKFKNYATG